MQIYWSATLPICSKHIRMSDAFFCVDASTKTFKVSHFVILWFKWKVLSPMLA